MTASDPDDLDRFVTAQDAHDTYPTALAELRAGRKRSHWMWFVFPQLEGLGHSAMSMRYALASREQAVAYLAHPVLGPRLRECAQALQNIATDDAEVIFGAVDAMKLRSSLTLFAAADEQVGTFEALLIKFFAGRPDPATRQRL